MSKEDCPHDRVRHGPGSAYHEIHCVTCRAHIGLGISVENAKKHVDYLKNMLEYAKQDVVASERFEAWQKAHPGVVPEP